MAGRRLTKKPGKRKKRRELATASIAEICDEISSSEALYTNALVLNDSGQAFVQLTLPGHPAAETQLVDLRAITSLIYHLLHFSQLMASIHPLSRGKGDSLTAIQQLLLTISPYDLRSTFPPAVRDVIKDYAEGLYHFTVLLRLQEDGKAAPLFRDLRRHTETAVAKDQAFLESQSSWLQRLIDKLRGRRKKLAGRAIEGLGPVFDKLFATPSYVMKDLSHGGRNFQHKGSLKKCMVRAKDASRIPYSRQPWADGNGFYEP